MLLGVGLFVALLPVLAVIVLRTGHRYVPLGDESLIDLRVRDVFTSNTPLVGAYSRGFNHPGPMLYWALAPLSVLAGGAAWATLVGAAALQGLAIAASGWMAFRRGGLLLALGVLTALGLAYSSFAIGNQLLQPWNPNVAFPFFMLFLLQVWSITLGHRWQVLWAAITATFLVQLHVGYLAVVAVPLVWAISVVVLDHRRGRDPIAGGDPPAWRRVVAWTAGSMAVLWSAVVYQQLTSANGNLSALVDYFRSSGATAGLWVGAGVYGAEFRIPPPWLGGETSLEFINDHVQPSSSAWLLVTAAILLVGFLAARRTGRPGDTRMLQLATVTAATSVVAISRVNVDLQDFLFYWRVVSAVFVVLAAAWALVNWLRVDERPVLRGVTIAVVLAIMVGFFGVRARDDVWRHRDVGGVRDAYGARLFEQAERSAPTDAPVLVRGLGESTVGFTQGLIDQLDRSGVRVRVDETEGFRYGDGRTATPAEVDQVWYVTQNGSNRSILDDHPGGRLVASLTPLSRSTELELQALQTSMADQLRAADRADLVPYLDTSLFSAIVKDVDGLDAHDVQRISDLNRRVEMSGGCRCLVIAYPAAVAPDLPSSEGF